MSEYNGYTNYETWNVALWIDNEQYSQEYWREQAENAESIHDLEEELKQYFQDEMPVVTGTYADLLQSALDNVNWRELAEMYFNEAHEEDEEEKEIESD
jgi:hypothetical protein